MAFDELTENRGLTINFRGNKDDYVVQKPTRSGQITQTSTFKGCWCVFCALGLNSQAELKKHMIEECLQSKFRYSDVGIDPLFHCSNCMPPDMYVQYETIVYHTFYFCTLNYRNKCTYCGNRQVYCECTRQRESIKDTLECMISDAKDTTANLLNRRNSLILTMFLEWDKQERLEVLESFLAQDNKVWPEEETSTQTSIIDMDMKLFVQGSEKDKLSIYMKYTNSDVKYVQLETINDYLHQKSNQYKELPNQYEQLGLETNVTLNWRVPHHLDSVCSICFQDTEDDPHHSDINHPRCWCSTTQFIDEEEMIRHTNNHQSNARCPHKSCRIMLKTFMDLLLHCDAHPELGILDRPPCSPKESLDWRECNKLTGNPMQSLKHTGIYHLKSKQDYATFIEWFKRSSDPNWGDSQYDLTSSNPQTQQQVSFCTPNNLSTNQQAQTPATITNSGQQQPSLLPTLNSTGGTGNNQGSGTGGSNNNNGGSGMTQIQRMKFNMTNSQDFPCENKKCKEKR